MTESPEPTEQPLDLLYSETEDDLRAAVRALLADRAGHQTLLGRIETESPYVPGLWKSLAGDIGAAGLLVPEKLGGQGASHREAAVVLEELGRAVTPLPYLTSAVVATETLLAVAGESEAAAGLLAELAGGRTVAALAVPLSTAPDAGPPSGGPVAAVADAGAADVFLVPRADGLYAVPADEATVAPHTPLDLTRPLAAGTTAAGCGAPPRGGPPPRRAGRA
ncbi:acyl-CoA dehydrogenase family protein, partial [Streptomyces sp. NPDC059556]|uniref:acyl-CoA dehydrogenase family protein n=1 Tax=Streptomyces sp. NPDC059556 TaxID=3346863 RepID=UPI0036A94D87